MNIFNGKIPVIVQSSICASAVVFINKCSFNLRQQKLLSLCMCTKFKLYFNFNINKQTKSIRERVFYKNIFWKIRQTLQKTTMSESLSQQSEWPGAFNFVQGETLAQVFPCEFWELVQNSYTRFLIRTSNSLIRLNALI